MDRSQKVREHCEEELAKIEADERYHYPRAKIFSNAMQFIERLDDWLRLIEEN